MKPVYLVGPKALVLVLAAAFFIASGALAAWPAPPAQLGGASDKPTVYVSDFDLDVLPLDAARNPSTATPSPASADARKQADGARKQAAHMVDLMAANLVQALQKAGYTAVRLHAGDARPDHGVRIRGIFAEVDKENHWRRAVIRSTADSGKIQALVSVANLDKPDQTLYEIANLPGNANKPGAVITLSPYVPLAKFDFDKDAPEEAFQKTAAHIVTDVTALLNANPAAVSQ
jgi:hypothetical protein